MSEDRTEVLTATFVGVDYILIRNADRPGYHTRQVTDLIPGIDASLLWDDPEIDVLDSIRTFVEGNR